MGRKPRPAKRKTKRSPAEAGRRAGLPAAGLSLLRAVLDTLPDHIYVKDLEGRYLLVNEAGLRERGLASLGEIAGKTVHELLPREAAERMDAEDRAVLESGKTLVNREAPTKFGDLAGHGGGERWHITSKMPLRDARGAVIGVVGVNRDITERRRIEEALRESEQMFRATFDQATVGITLVSPDLRYLRVNDKFCEIVGYSQDELRSMGLRDTNAPAAFTDASDFFGRLAAGEVAGHQLREKELVRKDGSRVWVAIAASLVRGANEQPLYFVSVIQDISEAKRAAAALRESEERFRRTFELAGSGVAHIGMDRRFLRVNRRLCEILGYSEEELLRLTGRQISHPEDVDVINAQRPSLYAGEIDAVRVEKRYLRKDGSVIWVAFTMVVERGAAGDPEYEIAFFDDITSRKNAEAALRESEERFHQLAHHDTLTNLPNRALFYDRMQHALALAKRNHWTVGVMLVDLDRFKTVNDTLGHAVGDKLLRQVAERLAKSVRASDTLARLGGDEFAVVLNLSAAEDVAVVAHKILAAFQAPFQVEGHSLLATLSIGAALYPNDSIDQETLLKNADAAMYRSKEAGRNCFSLFSAAGSPGSRP